MARLRDACHPPSVPRSRHALGVGLVALAATLWGCWSLFLRPAGLSGAQCTLVVLLVMSAPGPLAFRRSPFRDRGAAVALLLLGLADAGNIGLYFAALQRGPVALAVLTHYLAPVLVAIAAPLVLRERRSRRADLGAVLSLAGLALLVWRPAAGLALETALLGAGSALFYAIVVVSAKRAARSFSPLAVTSLHTPVSAIALATVLGRSALPPATGATLLVIAGGAVCGLAGSVIFCAGLARIPAQVAGALTYLEPLTAALVGYAAFGERLDPAGIAGVAVILAAGAWTALGPSNARA